MFVYLHTQIYRYKVVYNFIYTDTQSVNVVFGWLSGELGNCRIRMHSCTKKEQKQNLDKENKQTHKQTNKMEISQSYGEDPRENFTEKEKIITTSNNMC